MVLGTSPISGWAARLRPEVEATVRRATSSETGWDEGRRKSSFRGK